MRKIEKDMLRIIEKCRYGEITTCNRVLHNTRIVCEDTRLKILLHNNLIYKENLVTTQKEFSLAKWPTPTTRSRLRALGINVYQENNHQYFNGKEIFDYSAWIAVPPFGL